jgi:hypothetical protein
MHPNIISDSPSQINQPASHGHPSPSERGGGEVFYLEGAQSSVYIRPDAASFKNAGTAVPIKKLQNHLDIAPWGEDNRFPQNIAAMIGSVGIAMPALNKKLKRLWAQGILPCEVVDYAEEGKKEIIKPLDRKKYAHIYEFIEDRRFTRFMMEFLQDWVTFANCFPEGILSKDGKTITGWVHQESCDARYKQMNESGQINTVYLSKLWGFTKDQFVKFDKSKSFGSLFAGLSMEGGSNLLQLSDNEYVKKLHAIDPYNALESLQEYTKGMKATNSFKSFILPVNYPSSNKTYYQLPVWDGARVAGWFDIAKAIPNLIQALLNNAFHIKYHIEIPTDYFKRRVGTAEWEAMKNDERQKVRRQVLVEMGRFLKGTDKAGSAFVSEFDSAPHDGKEYNRIKITEFNSKIAIDKEFLASASANSEILFAMEQNPDEIGAGVPGGAYGGNKGGSNIREGSLLATSELKLERELILEPLYLTRDYNKWGSEIQFRFRDTILTTLDKNSGTEKVIS